MSDEQSYPITYVKGDRSRLATNAQREVELRADGWRPQNEPAPERGSFSPIPPPPPVDGPGTGDETAQVPATPHAPAAPAAPEPSPDSVDSVVPGRRRQPRTTT